MPSKLITIPEMIDLALGQSQHNIVNFSILHSLLHLMVRQLDFQNVRVEFGNSSPERNDQIITNKSDGLQLKEVEEIETRNDFNGGIKSTEDDVRYVISIPDKGHDVYINSENFVKSNVNLNQKLAIMSNDVKHNVGSENQGHEETIKKNNNDIEAKPIFQSGLKNSYFPSINNQNYRKSNEFSTNQIQQSKNFNPVIITEKLQNLTNRSVDLESITKQLQSSNHEQELQYQQIMKILNKINLPDMNSTLKSIKCSLVQFNERINTINSKNNIINQQLNDTLSEIKLLTQPIFTDIEINFLKSLPTTIPQLTDSIDHLNQQKVDLTLFQSVDSSAQKIFKFENEFIVAMTEIQQMLDAKFDKAHVDLLKNFLKEQLLSYQNRLYYISSLICDEAAGTTHRLLRNVHCLSCGKHVVQRCCEDPLLPKMQSAIPQKPLENLSLRFVGGSHTKITREDRVPEKCVLSLQSQPKNCSRAVMIEGNDGKLYYGDLDE